jgi:hypothetical protein
MRGVRGVKKVQRPKDRTAFAFPQMEMREMRGVRGATACGEELVDSTLLCNAGQAGGKCRERRKMRAIKFG